MLFARCVSALIGEGDRESGPRDPVLVDSSLAPSYAFLELTGASVGSGGFFCKKQGDPQSVAPENRICLSNPAEQE